MLKKVFYLFCVILVIIQFFHPTKNSSDETSKDIAKYYVVPDSVQQILKKACNDCHSNYTAYPWYSKVQPIAWWLQNHIDEGKHHLNFNEFANYSLKKQAHKLHEVAEVIEEDEMPLSSYTMIHQEARLNKEEKETLIKWANEMSHQVNPNQQENKEHH